MKNTRNPIPSLLASICPALAATGVQAAEPLALQKVMKELGKNMQIITDGISREDWELVEKNRTPDHRSSTAANDGENVHHKLHGRQHGPVFPSPISSVAADTARRAD